ncbi:DUF4405 domain-containing protein [Candidatus Woesearchaeota archaeon]|nr:DUF4405 domain-containing protein [Candidatus Woesearchaeota archaeon]
MNKAKINYWIDIVMGLAFLVAFVTGIIKWPGLLLKLGVDLKTFPLKQISNAHDVSGLIMSILVFVHLAMHWNFMVVMTKKLFKRSGKSEE